MIQEEVVVRRPIALLSREEKQASPSYLPSISTGGNELYQPILLLCTPQRIAKLLHVPVDLNVEVFEGFQGGGEHNTEKRNKDNIGNRGRFLVYFGIGVRRRVLNGLFF